MNDGNPDSGIEFDLSSLLSGSDAVELEFEDPPTSVQQTAPEYHELKSRVVVVGRWVDCFSERYTNAIYAPRPFFLCDI